jgi:predicted Zn-dependent protease
VKDSTADEEAVVSIARFSMSRRILWPLALLAFAAMLLPVAPAHAEDIGRQMEREYGVVGRDTEEGRRLNDQLDRVTHRITDAAGFRLRSATLLGGRAKKTDDILNAFALPDGRIYVTLGLMRAVQGSPQSDAELAFIVGHEMTHVKEKHGKRQQDKALTAGILGIFIGTVGGRAAGDVAGLAANAYVSKFSRQDEYRADKGALLAMHQAGYPLEAGPAALQRLRDKYGDANKTMTGLFGSHPLTRNRISRAHEIIGDIRAGREVPDRSERDLRRDDERR